MEAVVPGFRLGADELFCPKKGNSRLPMPLSTMLRIHFMPQWFGYTDPAMEDGQYAFPCFPSFLDSMLLKM